MTGRIGRLFGRRQSPDISDDLWMWVVRTHPVLTGFATQRLASLRELADSFLATRQLYPVGDTTVTAELRISVAVQASLPVLELGLSWYKHWSTIVLTEEEFDVEMSDVDEAGVVHETEETASGQFLPLGSIILSVADIRESGWCDGYNVVIHEMAHVLDRTNGALDGAPRLHREMDQKVWTSIFTEAYRDLQQRVSGRRERSGRSTHAPGKRNKGRQTGSQPVRSRPATRLDPYAAEAPEEFFAVASETFFEQPWVLADEYPGVYDQLRSFYRRDPRERIPSFASSRGGEGNRTGRFRGRD
ncbi:MAG TPA: M90 family metallopeptidase [Spirochaetia bacterium]|nr:M90 family metallopeptidase [Spirochaetia bacterium]